MLGQDPEQQMSRERECFYVFGVFLGEMRNMCVCVCIQWSLTKNLNVSVFSLFKTNLSNEQNTKLLMILTYFQGHNTV